MLKTSIISLFILFSLLLTACNGQTPAAASSDAESTSNTESPNLPTTPAANVNQSLEQLANLQDNNEREGVFDQETLKSMLPSSLLGMPKDESSIKTNVINMGEVQMSQANASFHDPAQNGRRIEVHISDGFGMQAVGMNLNYTAGMDIQNGTEHTYTTNLGDDLAIISFDSADRNGNLTVVHGQTTIVLEGHQLSSEDQLLAAYHELPLSGL